MERELTMIKDKDETEFTHYAINNDEQAKVNTYLKALDIGVRKRQNINFVKVNVEIVYFPNENGK